MDIPLPDFLLIYGRLISSLNELLGMRFLPGFVNEKSEIGKILQGIIEFNNSGNTLWRDIECLRLGLFIMELREIKSYDEGLFLRLKKSIHRSKSSDSFFGTRFEVHISSLLIKKGIEFEKDESPDFNIQRDGKNNYIECTSARSMNGEKKIISIKSYQLFEKNQKNHTPIDQRLYLSILQI